VIVLVSCYELGRPPLGLAQPAAFLLRAGIAEEAIDLVDLAVEPLPSADDARLRRARLVAVSVPMHTALRLGLTVVEHARRACPDAVIVAFGLYAPLCADLLREHGVDRVLGGEHEAELAGLARAIVDGVNPRQARLTATTGASAGPAVILERLDFPPPARNRLPPLASYAHLLNPEPGGGAIAAGAVEATRGCLHLCRHCPIPSVYDGRLFVVPRDVVLADVDRLVAAGAGHVTFADADFLNAPGHTLAIVETLHQRHPTLTFDVTVKVEHLLRHRARLAGLRASGCTFLTSAVESLSDGVLEKLDKGHSRADVFTALALVEDAGIAFRPTFVPFTPWSTLDDYLELCRFIEDNGLHDRVDPVQLTIRLLVPPGSLLLEHDSTRAAFGPFERRLVSHTWVHEDPRMDELQREVASLVEQATDGTEETPVTFARIHRLAETAAGRSLERPSAPPPPPRRRAPRMSEPWFC
jgi:radical SAM superfamily enzyme YgiQ (UPF0313 family)